MRNLNHSAAREMSALPTDPARRLTALDTLRGFAVLGILLMNISAWAYPDAMPSPLTLGCDTPLDFWTLAIKHTFVEGTMRALFSMLFGAGVVLLTTRLEAASGRSAAIYYRRTFWLIVFGLLQAYLLLWPGDILYVYGVVGLFLYFVRKLSPRILLLLSILCVIFVIGQTAVNHWVVIDHERDAAHAERLQDAGKQLTDEQQEHIDTWYKRYQDADDPLAEMHDEIATRRGNYLDIARWSAELSFDMQTIMLIEANFLDAAIAMLLGMALMKWRVLAGERRTLFYILLMVSGYSVGLPIKAWEGWYQYIHDFDWVRYSAHWYTYDIGRITTALGHVGLIILLTRCCAALHLFTSAVAAVGRMALTNYIMHSVICGLIFYGVGLGLVARVSRYECLLIALGIWIFQLFASSIWLRFFRFGPLEWLWRTLTYMRPAPMRTD